MSIILTTIGSLFLLYLGYSVIMQLILSLAAKLPTKNSPTVSEKKKFLLIIPAYREDKVIERTVKCALNQQYASENFSVVLIADSLQEVTLEKLSNYPIDIVEYSSPNRTKTKAIQHALKRVPKNAYDVAVVIDADNQLAPDFLLKIEAAFILGARAVQGKRTASNLDSAVAVLDAAAEAINHQIYCKGAHNLGISPRLMGSGMAFDLELFRLLIERCEAIGGFDKELELELSRMQIVIDYVEDAIVYDEKVRSKAVFGQQRKRWISAQFFYLGKYWKRALRELGKGNNLEFATKVSMLSFPPRLILPILLGANTIISFLLAGWNGFSIGFGLLLVLHLFSLWMALPKQYYSKKYLFAWLSLLPLILQVFKIMGNLKGSNKSFIHTPHGE